MISRSLIKKIMISQQGLYNFEERKHYKELLGKYLYFGHHWPSTSTGSNQSQYNFLCVLCPAKFLRCYWEKNTLKYKVKKL